MLLIGLDFMTSEESMIGTSVGKHPPPKKTRAPTSFSASLFPHNNIMIRPNVYDCGVASPAAVWPLMTPPTPFSLSHAPCAFNLGGGGANKKQAPVLPVGATPR